MFNLEETYEYDAVYLVSLLNFTDRNISDDIRIEMRLIDVKATRTFMNGDANDLRAASADEED